MHNAPYELRMRPDVEPMSRMNFRGFIPLDAVGIAGDGFLQEGMPWIDAAECLINVDHHTTEAPRWALKASSKQLHELMQRGVIQTMLKRRARLILCLNDPDPDASLLHFLCQYMDIAQSVTGPKLNRLVTVMSVLDETAGAYPYTENLEILEVINGLTWPYWEARFSGELDRRNPQVYKLIADQVAANILAYIVHGHVQKKPIDTAHKVLATTMNFALVEEYGPQAVMALARTGFEAYVAVRERPDGQRVCAVKKINPGSCFDPTIFYRLANVYEGTERDKDCWGGGDMGGSPRVRGTRLLNDQLLAIAVQSMTGLANQRT